MVKCPICGQDVTPVENEDGLLVCPICGAVISDRPIEYQPEFFSKQESKRNLEESHYKQDAHMTTLADKLVAVIKNQYDLSLEEFNRLRYVTECLLRNLKKYREYRSTLITVFLQQAYKHRDEFDPIQFLRVVEQVRGGQQLRVAQMMFSIGCRYCVKCKQYENVYVRRKAPLVLRATTETALPPYVYRGSAYFVSGTVLKVLDPTGDVEEVAVAEEGWEPVSNPVVTENKVYALYGELQDIDRVHTIHLVVLDLESGELKTEQIQLRSTISVPGTLEVVGNSAVYATHDALYSVDLEKARIKQLKKFKREKSTVFVTKSHTEESVLVIHRNESREVASIIDLRTKREIASVEAISNLRRTMYSKFVGVHLKEKKVRDSWAVSVTPQFTHVQVGGNNFRTRGDRFEVVGADAFDRTGRWALVKLRDCYIEDSRTNTTLIIPTPVSSELSFAMLGEGPYGFVGLTERKYHKLIAFAGTNYQILDGYRVLYPALGDFGRAVAVVTESPNGKREVVLLRKQF